MAFKKVEKDLFKNTVDKFLKNEVDEKELKKIAKAKIEIDVKHNNDVFFNKVNHSKNRLIDKIVDFDLEKATLSNLVDGVEKLDKISRLERGQSTDNVSIRWSE